MTDFNKIITDKITEMENSGTIQEIIEEKISETHSMHSRRSGCNKGILQRKWTNIGASCQKINFERNSRKINNSFF